MYNTPIDFEKVDELIQKSKDEWIEDKAEDYVLENYIDIKQKLAIRQAYKDGWLDSEAYNKKKELE